MQALSPGLPVSNTGAPPLTPSVPPGASDSHTAYRRWALDAKIQTAVLTSGSPPTSTSSLGFHPQEAALSSKEGGRALPSPQADGEGSGQWQDREALVP